MKATHHPETPLLTHYLDAPTNVPAAGPVARLPMISKLTSEHAQRDAGGVRAESPVCPSLDRHEGGQR